MKKEPIHFLSAIALVVGAVCCAQEPLAQPAPAPAAAAMEEVVVSVAGLYGDWKMVLPEWPGAGKPVTGDFCNFKKRDDGVSISCADDFLREIPEVTFEGDKLHMRWGGAFDHTIYDAVWSEGGFDGELVQASMGLEKNRIRARMERVETPATDVPRDALAALNNYFGAKGQRAGLTVSYYGKILHQKGDVHTFPDVFKVSNAQNAAQWCLVGADEKDAAGVRCHAIP